jgi:pSer/pThr/pTyr-binding forkhead associated (FHA) protein
MPESGLRPCPSCHTPNPPQFKFCGACGAPLTAPDPSPQPPAAAPAPVTPQPPAAAPALEVPAKTMFMDASQRPAMAGKVATIRLVLLREDGTEGGVLVIDGGPEKIGRAHGPPFDSDAYLSPNHAELTATREGLVVDDHGSLNGVFLKLEGRAELQHADLFRVGQELLLFEDLPEPTPTTDGTERMGSPNPGYWGRVSVMVSPDRIAAAFPIKDEGVEIGRENGDITFPDDGYVSGSHCRIVGDDDGVFLEDLGSSNGTYMRVRRGQVIVPGTLILIGQQLFRVELR